MESETSPFPNGVITPGVYLEKGVNVSSKRRSRDIRKILHNAPKLKIRGSGKRERLELHAPVISALRASFPNEPDENEEKEVAMVLLHKLGMSQGCAREVLGLAFNHASGYYLGTVGDAAVTGTYPAEAVSGTEALLVRNGLPSSIPGP